MNERPPATRCTVALTDEKAAEFRARAMVAAQADDVVEACCALTHAHVERVVLLCKRCGSRLGAVVDTFLVVEEPDVLAETHLVSTGEALGAVLECARKATDRRVELNKHRGKIDRDDRCVAVLETPSARHLPAALPLWCNRCGWVFVGRGALMVGLADARQRETVRTIRAKHSAAR